VQVLVVLRQLDAGQRLQFLDAQANGPAELYPQG
jgi:hypothetical protein